MRFKVVHLCQRSAVSAIPQESVRVDLERTAEELQERGYAVKRSEVMLEASKVISATIYPNGRLMIHPVHDKKEGEEIARTIYDLVVLEPR